MESEMSCQQYLAVIWLAAFYSCGLAHPLHMSICTLNTVGGQREGVENVNCLSALFAVALGMRG